MSDPVVETIESLKAELLMQKVIHEDQANQQANRVHSLETRLSTTEQRLEQCSHDLETAKTESKTLKEQVARVTSSLTTAKAESLAFSNQVHILETSNRDALGLIQRKVDEISRLEDELQKNQTALAELKQTVARLELEAHDLRSKETANNFTIERLLQEVTLHKAQNEWYQNELEAKSNEHSAMRKERGEKIARLEADLETARTQARENSDELAASKRHIEILEKNRRGDEVTIRELRERIASETETFYQEMVAKEKVARLWEQQAKETGERLKELDAALEAAREQGRDKDDQIVQLQSQYEAHLEALRQERDEAQRNAERLEVQVRRANELLGSGSIPKGENEQAVSMISKTAAVASKVQKFGMTFTEVYADYVKKQEQLDEKDREVERLNECLAEILGELNERAPEWSEMRGEYARLNMEIESMSAQLEVAIKERETAEEKAKIEMLDRERIERERNTLEKGTADLGRQVQYLVREIARHRGCSAGPPPPMEEPEEANTADEVVTGHLVPFRTVEELQTQNQNLLTMVRQLSATAEEAETQQEKLKEYKTTVDEAYTLVNQLRDELRADRNQKEAYKKEAESLRMALERRSNATPGTPIPSRLQRNGQEAEQSLHEDSNRNRFLPEWPDLREEYAALQDVYESLRREIGEDQKALREEADKYRREASEARKEAARSRNQVESMQRYEELIKQQQENNTRELKEYRERESRLQQCIAKFEIAASRADDERAVAEQQIQQMRQLVTTLQAEKQIATDANERLKSEADRISADNSRLSVLLSQTQRMQNQLEMTEREARRRAEMLAETLKAELQSARDRMVEEMENVRSLTARREAELREHRNKLDKVNQDHQKTREELVARVTSEEHLKQRVNELADELRRVQERSSGSEASRPMSPVVVPGSSDTADHASEDVARMKGELKQLRSDLLAAERRRVALESAAEQYRNISQANEETLRDTTASHEAYAAEATRRINELEQELAKAREHCAKMEESEGRAVMQLAELQERNEAERAAWEKEKRLLVEQVNELNLVEEQLRSVRTSLSEEIRLQKKIAREAREDYDREYLRRAGDIQALREMKDKYAELHRQVDGFKRQAENAKIALDGAQASWQEQKKALEQQIADMQKRLKDLEEQNDTLHKHLEAVNAQALRVQQSAAEPDSQVAEGSGTIAFDERENDLRQVIRFLRSEKNIVDSENNAIKLESQRLKQQLEHLRKELDESRLALIEERSKQQHAAMSEAQRVEYTTKIEQMNLLRESNVTLREENRKNEVKIAELQVRLHDCQVKLGPLEEEVQNLQVEVQSKDEEVKKLEESNASWRKRTQQILEKYERIDPVEHQKLKDDSEALRKEIDMLSTLKEQNETLANENNTMRSNIEELQSKVVQLHEKEKEIELLRASYEKSRRAHQAWQKKAKETEAILTAQTEELQKVQQEFASVANVEGQQNANAQQQMAEMENQLNAANAEKEMIASENLSLIAKYNALMGQARKMKEHTVQLKSRITEQDAKLKQAEEFQQNPSRSTTTGASDEAMDQVRKEAEEQRKSAIEEAVQRTTHEMMLRDQVKASMLLASKAENHRLQEKIKNLEIKLSHSQASETLSPPGVLSTPSVTATAPPALPMVTVPTKQDAPLKRPREVSLSPVRVGVPTSPSESILVPANSNKRPRTADAETAPAQFVPKEKTAEDTTLPTSENTGDRIVTTEISILEDTETAGQRVATEGGQDMTNLGDSGTSEPQRTQNTDATGEEKEATENAATEEPPSCDDSSAEGRSVEGSLQQRDLIESIESKPDAQILEPAISATSESETPSGEEILVKNTEHGPESMNKAGKLDSPDGPVAFNAGTDLPQTTDFREEPSQMDVNDETVRSAKEVDTDVNMDEMAGKQTLDLAMNEQQTTENESDEGPYDEEVAMNPDGEQEATNEYNEKDGKGQREMQENEIDEGSIGETPEYATETTGKEEDMSTVENEGGSEDLTVSSPPSLSYSRRPISPIRFDGPKSLPTTAPATTMMTVQPTVAPPPSLPVSTPTLQRIRPAIAGPSSTPVSAFAPTSAATPLPVTLEVSPAPVPVPVIPTSATPNFRPPPPSINTPSRTTAAVQPRVTLSASARPFSGASSAPSTPTNVVTPPEVSVTAPARTQQPHSVRPPLAMPLVLPTTNAMIPAEDPNSELRFKPKPITFDLGPDPVSTGVPTVKRKPQAAADGTVSDSRKPRIDRDQLPGILPAAQQPVVLSAFAPITVAASRTHVVPITPSSQSTIPTQTPQPAMGTVTRTSSTVITPSPPSVFHFGRSGSMGMGRGNQGMQRGAVWGVRGRGSLSRGGLFRGAPRGGGGSNTTGGGGTGGGTEGGA